MVLPVDLLAGIALRVFLYRYPADNLQGSSHITASVTTWVLRFPEALFCLCSTKVVSLAAPPLCTRFVPITNYVP